MKQLTLSVLCFIILLTTFECDNEADPPIGHLKLTVTYPEAVVENDSLYFIQVPGVGAVARLYDKDARCNGYLDARVGVAWIGDKAAVWKYVQLSNETGEILFNDIPAGEYYLLVYARQLSKYTEKYIEVKGGDTLELAKDFTASGTFYEDLEPWDYVMPPL